MKCELLCPECAAIAKKVTGDCSQYDGEHVKYVQGTMQRNPYTEGGTSICDHCGKFLPIGTPCVAFTIWSDHSPSGYQPWEHEFMEITATATCTTESLH